MDAVSLSSIMTDLSIFKKYFKYPKIVQRILDKIVSKRYNIYIEEKGGDKMSSRDIYDPDVDQMKLDLFQQEYIVTREKLIKRIADTITSIEGQINRSCTASTEQIRYLEAKKENLMEFQTLVINKPLFESLDDWWCYGIVISSTGTTLFLNHVSSAEIMDYDTEADHQTGWLSIEEYDAEYKLIDCRCSYLSTEEFAERCGIAVDTVRIWIRRGKIRSAMKIGNAWKIPNLTAPFTRGFTDAKYEWNVYLSGLPSQIEGIAAPGEILIQQTKDKKGFYVWYQSKDASEHHQYMLQGSEVGSLELYLIAQPAVEYKGEQEIINQ